MVGDGDDMKCRLCETELTENEMKLLVDVPVDRKICCRCAARLIPMIVDWLKPLLDWYPETGSGRR